MLFNSLTFLIFFPLAAIAFYKVPRKWQNGYLLAASYFVYMWWEPRYALLLLFSTAITYGCGLFLDKAQGRGRKAALALTISANLSVLVFFKYFNFFAGSIAAFLSACGIAWQAPKLSFLVPLGISFYTFQTIGYAIDVYRKKIPAEKNFFTYALFVSFFPQVASGPIGRAESLLPQFKTTRAFCYEEVTCGLRQMALGFFKKLAVADTLAILVNGVYGDVHAFSGLTLTFAAVCYLFQIYCDFSGYSDIAIGCAKVFGFKLMENFKTPLFSTSITEFWSRWHISLSSWFKDYLYIPLGGSHCSKARHLFNLAAIFLVSGLWHGAALTYLVWGALHAFYRVAEAVFQMVSGRRPGAYKNSLTRALKNIWVFVLVAFSFIFFRAATVGDALYVVRAQFTAPSFEALFRDVFTLAKTGFNATPAIAAGFLIFCAASVALLLFLDWHTCFKLQNRCLAEEMGSFPPAGRWALYYILAGLVFVAFIMQNGGFGASVSFLYLQY